MGDNQNTPLKLNFDSKVCLEFRGVTITSDSGLLACRELDDAITLTDTADDFLEEIRTGKNIRHKLIALLRQSVYRLLAGYDDTNDADRLSQDPAAMRVVLGWKGSDRNAASPNEMGRFETELLTEKDNLQGLERLDVERVKRAVADSVLSISAGQSDVRDLDLESAGWRRHLHSVRRRHQVTLLSP